METLLAYDYYLFYLINHQCHNAFLDYLMPFARDQYFWSPIYLFLLTYLFFNYPRRTAWVVLLGAIVTLILSDQISASLIKPLVDRLRPCKDPEMASMVKLLIPCGSGRSFVSSHATNHFAIATFFSVLVAHYRFTLLALAWAALVAYGQVYVGVHYPSDVLCGALLGVGIAAITVRATQYFLQKYAIG